MTWLFSWSNDCKAITLLSSCIHRIVSLDVNEPYQNEYLSVSNPRSLMILKKNSNRKDGNLEVASLHLLSISQLVIHEKWCNVNDSFFMLVDVCGSVHTVPEIIPLL